MKSPGKLREYKSQKSADEFVGDLFQLQSVDHGALFKVLYNDEVEMQLFWKFRSAQIISPRISMTDE
jgi:hypothetical protein